MTMSLLVGHRSSPSENSGHHQQQQPGPFYSDNRSSQIWGNTLARPPLWRATPPSTSPSSSSSSSSSVLLSSSLHYRTLEPKDSLQSETPWKNAQKLEGEESTISEGRASGFSSQSIPDYASREFQIGGAVNHRSGTAGNLFRDADMFSQAPKNDGFLRWNSESSSMFSESSNSTTFQKNDGFSLRDGFPKVNDELPKASWNGANYGNMASRIMLSEKNNGFLHNDGIPKVSDDLPKASWKGGANYGNMASRMMLSEKNNGFLHNDGFPNVGNDSSKACWQGPQYGTVHELHSAAALSYSFPSLQPSSLGFTQVATSATSLLSTLSPVTTIDAPATSSTDFAMLNCTNFSTENIDCSRSVRLKGMRPSDEKAKTPDIFTFGSCGQSSAGFRAGHASQKLSRHRPGKVTRPPRPISAKASAAVKHTATGDASNVFSMSASMTSASCSETTEFGIVPPENDASYRREFSSASKINNFAFTHVSPVLDSLCHNGTSTSTPSSTSSSASNDIGRTASGFEFLASCNKVQETEASKLDAMQSVEQQIRFWNPFSPIGDGEFKEDRVKFQPYGISDEPEGNITHFPNEAAPRDTYGQDVTGFDCSYPFMGNDSCGAAHGLGTSGNQASKAFSYLDPVMSTETRHDQNYNISLDEPSSFQGAPSGLGGTQELSSSSIPGKQSKEPFAFTGSKAKNEESFLFRASRSTSRQDVGHVQSAANFCGLDSSYLSGCRSDDVPISVREVPSTVHMTLCMPTLASSFESLSLKGGFPANTGGNCKAASQSSEPFDFRACSSFSPFNESSIFGFAPSAVAYNRDGESKPAISLSSAEPLVSESPSVTGEIQLEDNNSLNSSQIFEFQGSNKYSFPRRRNNVRHLRANLQRQGRYVTSKGKVHRASHSRKPHMEPVDEAGEESDNSKDKWNHIFDEDLGAELLSDATAELTIGAKGAATKEESFIDDLRIAAKNLKLGDKQEATSAKSSYGAYEEVSGGDNSDEQAPTSTQSWFEDLKVRTENLKIQDEQESHTRKSCYEGDQEVDQEVSGGKTGDKQATTIEKSQLFDGLKGGYDESSGEHIWRTSKEEESTRNGFDNVLKTISKEKINEVQKDVCGYTSQSFSDNNQGKHFTFNATSFTSRRHTRKSYGGRAKSVKLGSSGAGTSKLESRESTPNMGVAGPHATTHDAREMEVGMENDGAGRGLPPASSASINLCSKKALEPAAVNAGIVESITPASPPSMKSAATERVCERWRLRGNEAYANGEFSKAEKCYSRGVNVVSANEVSESCKRAAMLCYSNRAATRMALGRIREALGDCTCAMAVDTKFFRVRLRAANCHLALGEVGYAISLFKDCLSSEEVEDSDPRIVTEAHEGLKKAQQLDEYSTRAKELLANYDSAGDALCLLNQALLISPYSEHLLEMKAQALLSLRRYNEVIKLCEQTIAPAERNHPAQERQHLMNPASNYSKGTSVDSGNIALLSWRCKMSAKSVFLMGRVEESIAILSKYEEIRVDSSASSADNIIESFAPLIANLRDLLHHKAAGNEAFKAGNYVEAIEHYSAALICNGESRPFNAICFCNRAAASQALGHITDAIADCSRAIALNPNYYKAISRRSTLHEMIRDYGQACQDLKRLITLYEEEESHLGRSGNDVAKDLKQARERLLEAEEEMKKDNPLDHYLILGVDSLCSSHEIKKAYKRAALKHHPDKACQFLVRNDLVDDGSAWKEVGDDIRRDAEHLFKMIGEAYAVLSDSAKRLRYDTDEELRKLKGRGSGIRFASSDSQAPRYEKGGKHRDRWDSWTGYAHKYQRWQTGPDAAQTDTYGYKDNYTWNGFKSKHNGYKDDADFDWNDS